MAPSGAPTLAPEAQALAEAVVEIVRETLGDALVGAYLHGSAVLGGLRPTSDLDVLAVIDRRTTTDERRRLVQRLLEISGRRAYRGPARPVELTILVAADVRPWRVPPRIEFLYGEWLRDDYEAGRIPEPQAMPDFGPEVALALQGNVSLAGPAPADVLDPVPQAELRRAVAAGVPSLLEDLESDTRNVLLTLARIWATVATDVIGSKDEAAAWVLERLPPEHRGVLSRARDMYLEGWDEDDWGAAKPAVRAHAGYVIEQIERLA